MKTILIVGAGYLQSFVIQRAKELGYYVLCVDGNPNAIGFQYADDYKSIDIKDKKACLEYAKQRNINGVITAATDFGVLTVSYIAKELGLPGLDYEVAMTIKNKYSVHEKLFRVKADDTEQAYEVISTEQLELIEDKIVFPVMVKPCDGSGSRGTSKVLNRECLKKACEQAMLNSISHKVLIEPFIEGQEYGVESFVYKDRVHVLGVMKKWMTEPPYYAELGHAYPSGLDMILESNVKEVVKKAIQAIGINYGPVNMDVLITKNGNIHVIDVGARMGGNLIYSHIIPIGTGIDYMGCVIRASVGDEINFKAVEKFSIATALLALTPGKVVSFPDVKQFQKEYDLDYVSFLKKPGDKINVYHTNIDGCGYIAVVGNDIKKCHDKAFKAREYFDELIIRQ